MKELTIEEKAQRYDEAIKIAREINNEQRAQPFNVMTRVFPELKESEDERIREALIENFKWFCGDYPETSKWGKDDNLLVKDIIAWLEKQGEPTDINPSEFDLRLNKLLKQFETLPKEELASSLSFYLNVVQNNGTYKHEEKQGEQKPNKVEPIEWSGKINSRNAKGVLKEMLDKKLKSADKVEPKFKVGDWIITPNNATKQIKRVTFGNYRFTDETFYNIIDTDNKGHLWTINDAKDGDVLQLGVVTAIFQKYIGNENCKCYCSVCDGIFEIPSQDDDDYYGCHDATPATKEQRELLFKSMKDDGYEWDAEKKELDKIEQKPSWSEEDEDIRDTIIRDLKRLGGDMVTVKPAYKEEVDWLKSLKYRFAENNEELN